MSRKLPIFTRMGEVLPLRCMWTRQMKLHCEATGLEGGLGGGCRGPDTGLACFLRTPALLRSSSVEGASLLRVQQMVSDF